MNTLQTLTRFVILLAAVALPSFAAANAQTASYTYAGTSCTSGRLFPGVGEVPFQALNTPRIGQTFELRTEGSADYPAGTSRRTFLLTGTSNTASGGITLPFDLSTLFPGEPVCGVLRTSDEVVTSPPPAARWDVPVVVQMPIPNNAALLGATFYQQVVSVELNTFGTFYRGITLSRGGAGTIGR